MIVLMIFLIFHAWIFLTVEDSKFFDFLKFSLFTGITDGSLIQWSQHKRALYHKYERVHDLTINSIVCTKNHYLTGGGDEILKQFDLNAEKLVKDYGKGDNDEWITTMAIIP